jgi:hypothetical protein
MSLARPNAVDSSIAIIEVGHIDMIWWDLRQGGQLL